MIRTETMMTIADVVRRSDSEWAIYFLLSAYLQALRLGDDSIRVPESITRLPLTGASDLRKRFEQLMVELDTASRRLDDDSCSAIRGALHLVGAAAGRLKLIGERPHAAIGALAAQAAREAAGGMRAHPADRGAQDARTAS